MTIAETGHLVFATLHTNSAVSSINRIIDVFPPHQQAQIRAQLSFTLVAVMSQLLVPRMNGGRVPAVEVMVPNAAIKNLIREDKIHQVYSQMQVGQGTSGMQTMNQALFQLYQRRQISLDVAYEHASDVDELRMMMEGRGPGAKPPPLPGRF
jgi:twitching motility protein PilT